MDVFNLSEQDFYNYLIKLSNEYYEHIASVSDDFFDNLVEIYEKRFNKKWNYLGASYRNSVSLPIYMGSLNKCKDEHQLNIFKKRISNQFVLTDKIDGMSLLYYKENNKISLYTRGDGFKGTDVSYLLKYVNFPSISNKNIIVRGELVMLKKTFEEKYKHLYENPRSMVCGLVNAKDKEYDKIKDLTFYAYSLYELGLKTSIQMFKILHELKFKVPMSTVCDTTMLNKEYLTKHVKDSKQLSPYEIDGLVITDLQIHSEKDGENPKHTIAFKILGNLYKTTVVDVEWNLSKFNIYKPRIKIDPVLIDGSTITYTSGFNAKYIYDNKVGPGAIIEMTKSGDVIPHIVNVLEGTKVNFPFNYKWCENDIDIEPLVNDEQNIDILFIKRLVSLFDLCEIKGLKEGIITNIVTNLNITTEKDFFNLNKTRLSSIPKIGDKSSSNILSCIEEFKQKITLSTLMVGSCLMPGFGLKKINDILDKIPEIRNYLISNVMFNPINVEGKLKEIGFKTTSKTFLNHLEKVKEYLEENIMIKNWMINKVDEQKPVETIVVEDKYLQTIKNIEIKGKKFCFSGFRNINFQKYIEENEGNVVDTVSKQLHYLIVKDEQGKVSSKIEKAMKYNITIINLKDN
jgi:DNA ligase (NAD+)